MFRKKTSSIESAPPTYIAQNSEMQGTLFVESNLLVDGIIHGTVEVRGDMEISASGLVEGPEVRARNLTVHGILKARVTVQGRLTLTKTARLEGDVNASALSVEPGAFYVGYIETGEAKPLPESRNYPELMGSADAKLGSSDLRGM
jgi:cytoskeletal protein CcmA (bactofilin family)